MTRTEMLCFDVFPMTAAVRIRPYRSMDVASLFRMMEEFQDHLVGMDTFRMLRRGPNFGRSYTLRMLRRVRMHQGVVFVAESSGRVVGWVAGIRLRQTKADLLEYVPMRRARVIELFVDDAFRGQGIGTLLLSKIETYFRKRGCNRLELEVYAFNDVAHGFYQKMGYRNLAIDMQKEI